MFSKKSVRRGSLKQAGFTMIELLVAVLVMGVGVLGVTGLQLVSLQNNQAALMRAEAAQLAYDIMDRIRVNPGTGAVAGLAYNGIAVGDAPAVPTNCLENTCTVAQMTAFDVAIWKCSLGAYNGEDVCIDIRDWAGDEIALPPETEQPGLPDGDGSIAVNAGTRMITVTVEWTGFGGTDQEFVISSQG